MTDTITTTVYGFGGGNTAEIGSGGTSAYPNKVGFFGTTPVAQQATTGGANATTVAVSTTTGSITSWGFSTSTQANNLITSVNDLRTALVTYGLLSS